MNKILLFFTLVILFTGCDGGLEPHKAIELSYIRGKIFYKNGKDKWPPIDSVKDMRVVAFKDYPPKDILTEVTGGNAIFTQESTGIMVDSSEFEIIIKDAPVKFNYIVVAQNYGSIFEWRAVGVYTTTGDVNKPSSLLVEQGKSYYLNLTVDFNNLPPQPF